MGRESSSASVIFPLLRWEANAGNFNVLNLNDRHKAVS